MDTHFATLTHTRCANLYDGNLHGATETDMWDLFEVDCAKLATR